MIAVQAVHSPPPRPAQVAYREIPPTSIHRAGVAVPGQLIGGGLRLMSRMLFLLLVSGLLFGCSSTGDGGNADIPSDREALRTYLEQVDGFLRDDDRETARLFDALNAEVEAAGTDDEIVDARIKVIAVLPMTFFSGARFLASLEPPEEAVSINEDQILLFRELAVGFDSLLADIPAAVSPQELRALFDEFTTRPGLARAESKFTANWCLLQELGEASGIEGLAISGCGAENFSREGPE